MSVPKTMQAIRVHTYGGIENMKNEHVPVPDITADEVLIKVTATAFNPLDNLFRTGAIQQIYPRVLPYTPNIEVSGTIAQVGANVKQWSIGDAVYGVQYVTSEGAAAEYIAISATNITSIPQNVSLVDAAAIPVGALTAWQALFDHGGLKSGQRVLITGAAGVVGMFAVELAKWKGAYVIGTASASSFAMLQDIGIDELIDYNQESIQDKVLEKVDVIVNLSPESPAVFNTWLSLLHEGGTFISATAPPDQNLANELNVKAIMMGLEPNGEQLAQITKLVEEDVLHLHISKQLQLSDLPDVHERAQAGKVRRKVVLVVNE